MSEFGRQSLPAAHTGPARQVGYRKPPEEHQFKKGVSGNPKGRPKTPLADAGDPTSAAPGWVAKVSNRKVKIAENGKTRAVTMKEAILLVVAKQALKGDLVAARIFLNHVGAVEQARHKDNLRYAEREVDYGRRVAQQAHHAEMMGHPPFEPSLHLGDIQADSKPEAMVVKEPKCETKKNRSGKSERERANAPVKDTETQWEGAKIEREIIQSAIEEHEALLAGPSEGAETQLLRRTS